MSQHFHIWRDKQTIQGLCHKCIWRDKQNQGESSQWHFGSANVVGLYHVLLWKDAQTCKDASYLLRRSDPGTQRRLNSVLPHDLLMLLPSLMRHHLTKSDERLRSRRLTAGLVQRGKLLLERFDRCQVSIFFFWARPPRHLHF